METNKQNFNVNLSPIEKAQIMKTNHCFKSNRPARAAMRAGFLILAALLPGNYLALAQDQAAQPASPPQQVVTNTPAAESQTAAPTQPVQSEQSAVPPTAAAETPAKTGTATSNGIDLNFINTRIDDVLTYLSKAAGFIVVYDARPVGQVSVIGQNLTKEEAVSLLNSELSKNGYGAVRNGARTLRIKTIPDLKLNNPVKTFNGDPDSIPDDAEVATWIIPIRYVEAQQLVSDISPFVSPSATIIANQAGNSIIITDAQSNTRHLSEIIKSIDSSAQDVTEVRVFPLRYADPNEMATLLSGLFPDQTGATSPIQVRGGRGGRGGFGGGRGGFGGGAGGFNPFAAAFGATQGGNSQSDRIKQRKQVLAVADPLYGVSGGYRYERLDESNRGHGGATGSPRQTCVHCGDSGEQGQSL